MRIRQGTGYNNIKVRITPLLDVLDLRIGSRLIHFATLDIEGYEYAILNALKFGKKFDKAGVSFCQIDVELHSYANQAQAMGTGFNFNEFWLDFLANSPYIPIKSDVTYFDHRKVTLINVADSVCRTLFRFDRYF
uniref:Methyltransferase FkbM domain-containing protein n=1 Tax=Plectus sambesii TaxID=2011161 RepID=A0A914WYL2_9BILA